jgi:tetratricopeptide (TPR) repeat protein
MSRVMTLCGAAAIFVAATASARVAHGAERAGAPRETLRSNSLKKAAGKKALALGAAPRAKLPKGADDFGPDEFALRYYASLNQTARVNAEISRLQRLYPAFEPPSDLFSAPALSGVNEGPLWELYSEDRFDELRSAIAARQREFPNWKPSADLMQKMQRKELRNKISALWREGRWQDVVDFIKGEKFNVADADVDVSWTVAESYARAKQPAEAVALYKSILTANADPQIRLATVQKAMAALPMSDVEPLIAMGATRSDGTNEFSVIANDITGARMAAYLHNERTDEVSPDDVAKYEQDAREGRDASHLGLIAWYDYKRNDYVNALEWFKTAIANGGDATIAHGLAHTLRALNLKRDAEEVSYAWREPLANNVILFLDLLEGDLTREVPPYIEPERLARYAKVTAEVASGEGAQALAWYAYNSCQFDVALQWFERAIAWKPRESTAHGYALTLRKTKKNKQFYELANRYDGLFPTVVEMLFPSGYLYPPTPCDGRNAKALHGSAIRMGAIVAPGPALLQQAASAVRDPYELLNRNAQYAQVHQFSERTRMDKVLRGLRGKFPVAVAVENPLRFPAFGMPGAPKASVPARPAALATALQAEPVRGAPRLVARRVPGVGPMPYENYGFSLLPGWNGVEAPTVPPASAQTASPGTLAAEEAVDAVRVGVQGLDAMRGAGAVPAGGRNFPPLSPAGAAMGPTPTQYPYPATPYQRPAQGFNQYNQPVSR